MDKMVKRFIIIAGANGTGKTTLAKEFLREYKIEFLNADEIALAMEKKGPESRIKAGKMFISNLDQVIRKKAPVAIESTLAGKYLAKTIKRVKVIGYRVSIIYFFVDNPDVALARIKSRVRAGGHNVLKVDVVRRFWRSKKNFWGLYKDIADEWAIFYNGTDRLMPVASGEKSRFDVMDDVLLSLFKKGEK
jgi:predicted ABC-type ATPase